MNNKRFILSALTLGAAMLVGCPGPANVDDAATSPDGGRDGGTTMVDTGVHADVGTDGGPAMADAGVPLTCAGLCAQVAAACTGTAPATDANPYGNMGTCMTQCTATMWTVGTEADTSGNTLGCRVYHSIVAGGTGMAMTHCPHTGLLGGGVCSPFRTDAATEVAVDSSHHHPMGYLRVDRMGVPAVATALVGPGLATAAAGLTAKDAYNDSSPTGDAGFVSGIPLLTAIGAYHAVLDDDLVGDGLTPCSVTHTFPVPGAPAPIPACGVQSYDGNPAHTVASLILPDTLRLDQAGASGFPNGRRPQDDVIDPILSALLLNLSPCAGTPHGAECSALTTANCATDTNCTVVGTACHAAALTPEASCNAATTMATCPAACNWTGTACRAIPCEFLPAAACGAVPAEAGCAASTCGAGACTVGTIGTLPLNPHANDVPFLTTFPYFADAQ